MQLVSGREPRHPGQPTTAGVEGAGEWGGGVRLGWERWLVEAKVGDPLVHGCAMVLTTRPVTCVSMKSADLLMFVRSASKATHERSVGQKVQPPPTWGASRELAPSERTCMD